MLLVRLPSALMYVNSPSLRLPTPPSQPVEKAQRWCSYSFWEVIESNLSTSIRYTSSCIRVALVRPVAT